MLNLKESGSHSAQMADSPTVAAHTPTHAAPAPPVTSEQAVTMWLSSHERRGRDPKNEANYRRWVQAFIHDQQLEHAEAITAKAIARYLKNLTTAGSSAANINNQRTAINQFCKWCRRYEILKDNPCESIGRVQNVDAGEGNAAFSPEQAAAFVAAAMQDEAKARPTHRAIRSPVYILAWSTGLRRKELRRLRWKHVVGLGTEAPRLELTREVTKNRKISVLPLTPEAVDVLQRWRAGAAPNDYVFPTPPEPGRPSVPHDRVVKADLTAAGIPHYNEHEAPYGMHSLRKGFCTTLAESGAGEMLGAKLMRHSDPRITAKVYNKARLKPLAEAVSQVPRLTAVTTKVEPVTPKTTTAALDIPMNGRQTDTVARPANHAITTDLSNSGLSPSLALPGALRGVEGSGPSGPQKAGDLTTTPEVAGVGFEPTPAKPDSVPPVFRVVIEVVVRLQQEPGNASTR